MLSLFPLLVIMLKGQFVPDGLFEELIFTFLILVEVDVPIVLTLLFFVVIAKHFFLLYRQNSGLCSCQ